MLWFWYTKRKQIDIQNIFFPFLYFMMYRTKWGLAWMDQLGKKHPKGIKLLADMGIVIGFLGMGFITYLLIDNLRKLIFIPGTPPGVMPVLPIKAAGVFYVPFFYWIISIFVIAAIHEYAHGVVARAHKIRVLSSGIAFLNILIPIVPAAFVEPDEKQITKRKAREQLGVFAAGPFANILLFAALYLVLLFALPPIDNALIQPTGVLIQGLHAHDPPLAAEAAGLRTGERILSVNGVSTVTLEEFITVLDGKKPGDELSITTNEKTYTLTLGSNPDNESMAYLGVFVEQARTLTGGLAGSSKTILPVYDWIVRLLLTIAVLSLGIGLFNLLPLGPIDGGRMMLVSCERLLGKKKGMKVWKGISMFFLLLLLVNLAFAFL